MLTVTQIRGQPITVSVAALKILVVQGKETVTQIMNV